MRSMRRVLLLGAVMAVVTAGCSWPMFRSGPDHTGASPDTGIAVGTARTSAEAWSYHSSTGNFVDQSPAVVNGTRLHRWRRGQAVRARGPHRREQMVLHELRAHLHVARGRERRRVRRLQRPQGLRARRRHRRVQVVVHHGQRDRVVSERPERHRLHRLRRQQGLRARRHDRRVQVVVHDRGVRGVVARGRERQPLRRFRRRQGVRPERHDRRLPVVGPHRRDLRGVLACSRERCRVRGRVQHHGRRGQVLRAERRQRHDGRGPTRRAARCSPRPRWPTASCTSARPTTRSTR